MSAVGKNVSKVTPTDLGSKWRERNAVGERGSAGEHDHSSKAMLTLSLLTASVFITWTGQLCIPLKNIFYLGYSTANTFQTLANVFPQQTFLILSKSSCRVERHKHLIIFRARGLQGCY